MRSHPTDLPIAAEAASRSNAGKPVNGELVLVPGGAGFVGSHLCDRLRARGHRVLALDDLSTGDRRHVAHLQADPGFELREHDIAHPVPDAALEATRIFNLACPASPAHSQRTPVHTTLTSELGAWRLLADPGLARELGAAARRTAEERFGIDRFVADWLDALATVAE